MSELTELITRLEKATGPDRELDCLISATLSGWPRERWRVARIGNGDRPAEFHSEWVIVRETVAPHLVIYRDIPAFTSSTDAAQAMVPKGLNWDTGIDDDHFEGPIFAHAAVRTRDREPVSWRSRGANPAIALCIAALKARQSSPESQSP